jgi:tRNA(His) guanylyltransferase
MDKTSLGNRMKDYYENRSKLFLPRRTYTMIRVDGKAFHTFTRGLDRPFDEGFVEDMNWTAIYMCGNIQGAKLAYVQSDEISVLMTDFDKLTTDAWFDGNVQKITSVSASMATANFNYLRMQRYFAGDSYDNISKGFGVDRGVGEHFAAGTDLESVKDDIASFVNYMPINPKLAMFDSRVFTLPYSDEVINYFVWRQRDCVKNSISSLAQSLYSHTELKGKNGSDMQEMCWQKGKNWNDLPAGLKRGRFIVKTEEGWKVADYDITKQREEFSKLIPKQ